MSIDFVVRANVDEQQNRILLGADKIEYDAAVVSHRARPEPCQLTSQLVGIQRRAKRICYELVDYLANLFSQFWMATDIASEGSAEAWCPGYSSH